MKSLFKPLGLVLLLVCRLAQAVVLPMPTTVDVCPQHSMEQMSHAADSMTPAACCKIAACECLQAPALAGPGPSAPAFVGTTQMVVGPLHAGVLVNPVDTVFRPPIL